MRQTSRGGVIVTCLVTCLVAAGAFAGAVSWRALLGLVLPAILITAVIGASRRGVLARLVAVAVTALILAEIVNVVSGDVQGPAARATAGGALLAGIGLVLATSRFAAMFLLPVVGIVAWAMALGAGGQVRLVAVATAVSAVWSLLTVERRQRRLEATTGTSSVAAMALMLVLAGTVLALVIQSQSDRRPPLVPFAYLNEHLPAPVPGLLPAARPDGRGASTHATVDDHVRASHVTRTLTAGLMLLMVGASGRLAWVRVSWQLLQQRLRRGTNRERIAGAWLFASHRLASLGHGLNPSASPDVVSRSSPNQDLRQLASLVERAVFAPTADVDAVDATSAWVHAVNAVHTARTYANRWERARGAWRTAPGRPRTA
jgi:hypothetical protein